MDDMEHLRQSIEDILTTPIGSRVMRRDYGSRLFELVDRPMNPALIADIQSSVAMALMIQEPRISLTQILVDNDPGITSRQSQSASGKISISIRGNYLPDGRNFVMDNIEISK